MSAQLSAADLAAGAVIFWSSGPSDREYMRARLDALGLGEYTPKQRTDNSALRAALKEHASERKNLRKGRDKLVQPHKEQNKNGFDVVDVELGEDKNDYVVDFTAKVENGQVSVGRGYADTYSLQLAFNRLKNEISSQSVSETLVKIMAHLGGVRLREAGGVYWIPQHALELWDQVSAIVEEAGKNRIERLRTIIDDKTVRAVQTAIVEEITAATAQINEDLASGIGEDAIDRRKLAAERLYNRVEEYEAILGVAMDALKAAVKATQQALTLAALAQLDPGIEPATC